MDNNEFLVLILSLVSFVLMLVAVVTNDWGIQERQSSLTGAKKPNYHYGLWKGCTKMKNFVGPFSTSGEGETCKIISHDALPPNIAAAFDTCRAFAILALIGVLCSAISVIVWPNRKYLHIWLYLISFVFALITMIVWAAKLKKIGTSDSKFGYSFYLFLSGALVALVTSLVSDFHHDQQTQKL